MKKYIKLLSCALLLSTAQATMHDDETLEVQENGSTLPKLPSELLLKILNMAANAKITNPETVIRVSKVIRDNFSSRREHIYREREFDEKIGEGYRLDLIPARYYTTIRVRGFLNPNHLKEFCTHVNLTRAENVSREDLMALTGPCEIAFMDKVYHKSGNSANLNSSVSHPFDIYAIEEDIFHDSKSTEQEKANAYFKMAMMKFQGIGVERDVEGGLADLLKLKENEHLSNAYKAHTNYQLTFEKLRDQKKQEPKTLIAELEILKDNKNLEAVFRYNSAYLAAFLKWNEKDMSASNDFEALSEIKYIGNDYEDIFENTNIDCRFELASIKYYGLDGRQDFNLAYNIFNSLKEEISLDNYRRLLSEYFVATISALRLIPESNQEAARSSYKKIIENFSFDMDILKKIYLPSLNRLGHMEYYGRGGPKDYTSARMHFNIILYYGHIAVDIIDLFVYELGCMEYYGQGGPKDYTSARNHLERSEQVNQENLLYAPGRYALADMYYKGLGGPKNINEARRLYGLLRNQPHIQHILSSTQNAFLIARHQELENIN